MVSFEILQMSYLQIFSYQVCAISVAPLRELSRVEVANRLSGILPTDNRQPLHLVLPELRVLKQLFLHLLGSYLFIPPETVKFFRLYHLPELPYPPVPRSVSLSSSASSYSTSGIGIITNWANLSPTSYGSVFVER